MCEHSPWALHDGDAVRVFSRTADEWVNAEVVDVLDAKCVRVEYEARGHRCGKTLHLHSADLSLSSGIAICSDEELPEHDPECNFIIMPDALQALREHVAVDIGGTGFTSITALDLLFVRNNSFVTKKPLSMDCTFQYEGSFDEDVLLKFYTLAEQYPREDYDRYILDTYMHSMQEAREPVLVRAGVFLGIAIHKDLNADWLWKMKKDDPAEYQRFITRSHPSGYADRADPMAQRVAADADFLISFSTGNKAENDVLLREVISKKWTFCTDRSLGFGGHFDAPAGLYLAKHGFAQPTAQGAWFEEYRSAASVVKKGLLVLNPSREYFASNACLKEWALLDLADNRIFVVLHRGTGAYKILKIRDYWEEMKGQVVKNDGIHQRCDGEALSLWQAEHQLVSRVMEQNEFSSEVAAGLAMFELRRRVGYYQINSGSNTPVANALMRICDLAPDPRTKLFAAKGLSAVCGLAATKNAVEAMADVMQSTSDISIRWHAMKELHGVLEEEQGFSEDPNFNIWNEASNCGVIEVAVLLLKTMPDVETASLPYGFLTSVAAFLKSMLARHNDGRCDDDYKSRRHKAREAGVFDVLVQLLQKQPVDWKLFGHLVKLLVFLTHECLQHAQLIDAQHALKHLLLMESPSQVKSSIQTCLDKLHACSARDSDAYQNESAYFVVSCTLLLNRTVGAHLGDVKETAVQYMASSGQEVGTFVVPHGREPFGPWLADRVARQLGQRLHGDLRLVGSDNHIIWSQPTSRHLKPAAHQTDRRLVPEDVLLNTLREIGQLTTCDDFWGSQYAMQLTELALLDWQLNVREAATAALAVHGEAAATELKPGRSPLKRIVAFLRTKDFEIAILPLKQLCKCGFAKKVASTLNEAMRQPFGVRGSLREVCPLVKAFTALGSLIVEEAAPLLMESAFIPSAVMKSGYSEWFQEQLQYDAVAALKGLGETAIVAAYAGTSTSRRQRLDQLLDHRLGKVRELAMELKKHPINDFMIYSDSD